MMALPSGSSIGKIDIESDTGTLAKNVAINTILRHEISPFNFIFFFFFFFFFFLDFRGALPYLISQQPERFVRVSKELKQIQRRVYSLLSNVKFPNTAKMAGLSELVSDAKSETKPLLRDSRSLAASQTESGRAETFLLHTRAHPVHRPFHLIG